MEAGVATALDRPRTGGLSARNHPGGHGEDEAGQKWELDFNSPGVVPLMIKKVRDRCISINWAKAGEHHCGEGLEHGADLTSLRKIRKSNAREGNFKEVGILDMLAQGAAWTPER